MNRRPYLLITIFCLFLAGMSVSYIVLPKADISVNEKKVLASAPELTIENVADGTFGREAEEWFSDHVPGREALIGINAHMQLYLGQNGLSGVIKAQDRLLAAPAEMDETSLERTCGFINRFAEKVSVPIDVLPVPEAGYILGDMLPALTPEYHDAEAEKIIRSTLSDNIGYIPAEDALRAAGGDAYYRTDHHFTSRGAYEVCRLYADAIGRSMPDPGKYIRTVYGGFYGSMYSRSGLWETEPDEIELWNCGLEARISIDDGTESDSFFFTGHLTEADKYPVFMDGNHALVTIETGNKGAGCLLVVRDSFGHCFAPFVSSMFEKVVLVDLRYSHLSVSELVQEIGADRVLILTGMDTLMNGGSFIFLR